MLRLALKALNRPGSLFKTGRGRFALLPVLCFSLNFRSRRWTGFGFWQWVGGVGVLVGLGC